VQVLQVNSNFKVVGRDNTYIWNLLLPYNLRTTIRGLTFPRSTFRGKRANWLNCGTLGAYRCHSTSVVRYPLLPDPGQSEQSSKLTSTMLCKLVHSCTFVVPRSSKKRAQCFQSSSMCSSRSAASGCSWKSMPPTTLCQA